MQLKLKHFLLIAFLVFLPIFSINADDGEEKGTIFVASDEIISGNLLAYGENIIIDGIISGDLMVLTSNLSVNGRVEGDIIALAQDIDIEGEVGGNIRVIANSVIINGAVARNVNAFGSQVILGENSKIGWDLIVAAFKSNIRGTVSGGVDAYANSIFVSAKVGENANFRIYNNKENGGLFLDKSATINGNLNYYAKNDIALSNSSVVSGEINHNNFKTSNKLKDNNWWWMRLFSILSLLFIGLIIISTLSKHSQKLIFQFKQSPTKALLWGMLSFLILPPIAIVSALTIIGIPFSLVILSLWLVSIFLGQSLAALILGDILIKKVLQTNYRSLFWPLLLGVIIISLLFSIPWFGWLINLISIWLGLGSILLYVSNKSKNI